MTYEKGRRLELKIADLFKKNGYDVTHNVLMKGKSGAEHQIDVLAEYKSPLLTTRIIVEAKSYESNIDKDIVMKLIQIQQDLSVDRAILATTSDFTPSALLTANQYNNIELWNKEKLASELGGVQLLDTSNTAEKISSTTLEMVEATVSVEDVKKTALESVEKKAKGGFMGRGKIIEKFLDIHKFLYPYYDVEVEVTVQSVEKTGLLRKERVTKTLKGRAAVDARSGTLIDVDDSGISYKYSILSRLDRDEIKLLSLVSPRRRFEIIDAYQLGLSEGKTRKLVKGLVGKRILLQRGGKPVTYECLVSFPNEPTSLVSIKEKYSVKDISADKKVDVLVPPASVVTIFEQYWMGCKVISLDLIYYPYYGIEYEREDHSKRVEIVDGVTGRRQEYLETRVSINS